MVGSPMRGTPGAAELCQSFLGADELLLLLFAVVVLAAVAVGLTGFGGVSFLNMGTSGVVTMLAQLSPALVSGPSLGVPREPENSVLLGRESSKEDWDSET